MLPLFVAGLLASAQPPASPAAAPRILVARVVDGHLVSRHIVAETVPVQVQTTVIVNGKPQVVNETRYVTRQVTRENRLPLKGATIREVGGKKLDGKELAKRLARPVPVVVSGDGREIDSAFLKLFQKDTILIVPAPSPEPAPPQPIPQPKRD